MSNLKQPPKVLLFIGIIYAKGSNIDLCMKKLRSKYGKIIFESDPIPFKSTKYYECEMGSALYRIFIAFNNLINRDKIIEAKIFNVELENRFSVENKRTINLDPGYLAAEHIILSTGKGFSHRTYIGKGVYADLTLLYQDNKFKPLDWTYPDYKDNTILDIFYKLRELYLNRLKEV